MSFGQIEEQLSQLQVTDNELKEFSPVTKKSDSEFTLTTEAAELCNEGIVIAGDKDSVVESKMCPAHFGQLRKLRDELQKIKGFLARSKLEPGRLPAK